MSRYLVRASLKVHATESRLKACHSLGPPGLAIKKKHNETSITCNQNENAWSQVTRHLARINCVMMNLSLWLYLDLLERLQS